VNSIGINYLFYAVFINLFSLIFTLYVSVRMTVEIKKVLNEINNSAVNFILAVQIVQKYCMFEASLFP
jgi:hypothetical protein